jgi:hypothetical protein
MGVFPHQRQLLQSLTEARTITTHLTGFYSVVWSTIVDKVCICSELVVNFPNDEIVVTVECEVVTERTVTQHCTERIGVNVEEALRELHRLN